MSKICIANMHNKAQGAACIWPFPGDSVGGVVLRSHGDLCAIGTDEAIAAFDGHPVRKYDDVAAKGRRHPK